MNPNLRSLLLPTCLFCSAASLAAMLTRAQDIQADRASVHLTSPSHPASVRASLKNGGIKVIGYNGNEVLVEARFSGRQPSFGKVKADPNGAPSKLDATAATGLKVEEENNLVRIGAAPSDTPIDLIIQVPFKTSLNLVCLTNGAIRVENVDGEIEASNQRGPVTLTNVAGVVVADARNGKLLVQLNKVAPDKPMSFSTVNGDIDVTLPADIKAKIDLATQNGRIDSEFDAGLPPGKRNNAASLILNADENQLSLVHKVANINGGGAEISFKTVNGNVHIRKGQSNKGHE
ncbi:MAG: DUF4097 family beta strand repeat-containing protein [Verrucomicrobiota bacterium]